MPALNFKAQWADKVESGEKPHTIRAWRKRPIKVGDRLYLYTGMRTKACRKLGESVCISALPVRLWRNATDKRLTLFYLDDDTLGHYTAAQIAKRDGFNSLPELFDFFLPNGGTFQGQLIEWSVPIS